MRNLRTERLVLKNVAKLQENANAAYAALYDAPESVSTQVRTALKKLEELCQIDASMRRVVESLKAAAIGVDEASDSIRDYLDRLEADPNRLDEIESRLALIERLKRKYGSSLDDVLAFLDDVRIKMEAIETAGERRTKLEQDLAQAGAAYQERGRGADQRAKSSRREAGEESGNGAGFPGARKRRVSNRSAGKRTGSEMAADRVEFLISANAGEEPRALDKVASGGELSRIALALKTSLGFQRATRPERRAANSGLR